MNNKIEISVRATILITLENFIQTLVFDQKWHLDNRNRYIKRSNLLWCDPAELWGEIWTEAGSLGKLDFTGIRPLSDGLDEPADWLWNDNDVNNVWINKDCWCSWPSMNRYFLDALVSPAYSGPWMGGWMIVSKYRQESQYKSEEFCRML